jgi:hypothetical protein
MNVDFDAMCEMLRQVVDWMEKGGKETTVPIGVRKTEVDGQEGYQVFLDRDTIGLLIVALTSDELLKNACFFSMVKILGEMDEEKRRETVRMLGECGRSLGDTLDINARADAGSGTLFYVARSPIQS